MSSNTFIEQQQVPIQALLPEVPKPKRPRTSYNLFFKSEQEKLQRLILEGKCSIKRSNIANIISESWKQITPSVRLHYDQLAAEDKFRYMNERIEYKSYLERRRTQEKLLKKANALDKQPPQPQKKQAQPQKRGSSKRVATAATSRRKTAEPREMPPATITLPQIPTAFGAPALNAIPQVVNLDINNNNNNSINKKKTRENRPR